ncbi:MAG: ATP-binding protein [Pseudomonadota bacterium]
MPASSQPQANDSRRIRSPLAAKLLRTVLSIYLLAAFGITCFQLVLEYREEQQRLRLELDQIAEAFLPVLAPALWNLDNDQVSSTSAGIWVNPAIWRLTVHDDRGVLVTERVRDVDGFGSGWNLPSFEYAYDVRFFDRTAAAQKVGVLTLASNTYVVARRATGTFLFTIANAVLKTLLLWLITYYVLVRLVARPLSTLTRTIHGINPDTSSESRSEEHLAPALHTDDELGEVAVSVNQLETALIEKNRAIVERQQHLETTVAELERASAAKSRFLAHMSHELRTPLNGMLGMTELLTTTPLNGQQAEYLDTLTSSSQQLLAVINNILDYSKIEAGRLELERIEFDLHRLVSDCVALAEGAAGRKGLSLQRSVRCDGPAQFLGDPTKLRLVLDNLLNNAIKFTSEGSVRISVEVEVEDAGERTRAHFEVTDTGIGIAPEQQLNLFESFRQGDQSTTRQFGGTGLGLAICRQLVELMGGAIEVRSEPEQGTTFSFAIPLATAAASARPDAPPADQATELFQYPSLRVLVAEDNQINQKVVNGMLKRFGVNAVFAADGAQALERCAVPDARFDLVFMDIEMPVLDGWAATRALRQGPAADRVGMIVGLSAHALRVDREKAEACGMDDYLAKPISMNDLAGILRKAAGNRATQPNASGRPPAAPRSVPARAVRPGEP